MTAGYDVVGQCTVEGVALGQLQLALVEARSPGGPGGRNITEGEWAVMGKRLDELIHRAADLRAQVSARSPGA